MIPASLERAMAAVDRNEGYMRRRWLDYRVYLGTEASALERAAFYFYASGRSPLAHSVPTHLVQVDRLDSQGKPHLSRKLVIGGFGSGKTHQSCDDWIMHGLIPNPNCRHLAGAPTYWQASEVLLPHVQEITGNMARRGFPLVRRAYENLGVLKLWCGGKAFIRTYSKTGHLMGLEFASVLLTEIEEIGRPAEEYGKIVSRVRQPEALRRSIICESTPDGWDETCAGVWRDARAEATEDELPEWYWTRVDCRGNPFVPPDYLEGLRKSMSASEFKAKALGAVIERSSRVIPEYRVDRHVIDHGYVPGLPIVIGYDPGDLPHLCVYHLSPRLGLVAIREWCEDHVASHHLHGELMMQLSEWGGGTPVIPEWIAVDPTPTDIHRELRRLFPHTVIAAPNQAERDIEGGLQILRRRLDPAEGDPRLWLDRSLVLAPPVRGLHHSMQRYTWQIDHTTGRPKPVPNKDNVHDHAVDQARYVCRIVERGRGFVTTGQTSGGSQRRGERRRR